MVKDAKLARAKARTSAHVEPTIGLSPVAKPAKASKLAADQIRELILNGVLGDGDALPSEVHLTKQLGISRSSLREALRILETEDLITTSRGVRTGAKVHTPTADTPARYAEMAMRAQGATLAEAYQAQLAFEPYAARLLAERASPADIAKLSDALKDMEGLLAQRNWAEASAALARYHLLIVRLTGNRALTVLAEMLAKILLPHQTANAARGSDRLSGAKRTVFRTLGAKSIAKLLAYIRSGDAAGAESHWREHLKNSSEYWLGGCNPQTIIGRRDS